MSFLRAQFRKKVSIDFDRTKKKSQSKTQQQFRKDADLNSIMAKYQKTGQITYLNPRKPQFGDFASFGDFQTNMTLVARARQEFEALPSRIRERFQNDPAKLLAFLNNNANYDEAVKLGILEPKKVEAVPGETGAAGDTNGSGAAPAAGQSSAPAATGGATS